jgi:hypothetical protein
MSYREVRSAINRLKSFSENMKDNDDPKGGLLEVIAEKKANPNPNPNTSNNINPNNTSKSSSTNNHNSNNDSNNISNASNSSSIGDKENKVTNNPYFRKKLESQITQTKFKIELCRQENKSLSERYKKSEQDNYAIIQLFEKLVAAYSVESDLSEENLQVKIIEEFLRERGIKKDDTSSVREASADQYKDLANIFFSSSSTTVDSNPASDPSTAEERRGSSRSRSRERSMASSLASVEPMVKGMDIEGVSAVLLESSKKLPGYMNCKYLVILMIIFFILFTIT